MAKKLSSESLFKRVNEEAQACREQIKQYKETAYNPHQIDFTAEAILFNTMCENIARLKTQNGNDEDLLQKIVLAFSDYIDALRTIMEARIYLSVDMKDDALDTMGRKVYQPRITIKETSQFFRKLLGEDYTDPATLIPEDQKTPSCVSLYSLI